MMLARTNNLVSDFLSDPFDTGFFSSRGAGSHPVPTVMKTDIKETEHAFVIDLDLPGFKKENVHAELEDSYLTVSATTKSEVDTAEEGGTYLRKERFTGSCSRSFYVGDDISEDDISAKFEDGVLTITVPKKQPPAPEESKKLIAIG